MSAHPEKAIAFKPRDWLALGVVLLAGAGLIAVNWTGFLGSDDSSYATAAARWLDDWPYVGQDHWSLRHPLVLSIAASFALLGRSEFALILPSMLMTLALGAMLFVWLRGHVGAGPAAALAIFAVSTPVVAIYGSIANVDVFEAGFCLLSLMAFCTAFESRRQVFWLALAGVFAGLAFLSRETAVVLLLIYGVLFLAGFGPMPRWRYWVMAAGFLPVVLLEMAYFTVMVGDPLHRWMMSAHHDQVVRLDGAGGLDRSGNFEAGALFDPLLMVIANQEFALLFLAFAPAAWWAFRTRTPTQPLRWLLRALASAALVWLAFLYASAPILYLEPRYMMFASLCAAVVVGLWIALGVWPRYRRLAAGLAALLVLGNLAGILLSDGDHFDPERRLVALAAESPETVYTDPRTRGRVAFLLDHAGIAGKVSDRPPPPGGLFYSLPRNVDVLSQRRDREVAVAVASFRPGPDWAVVGTFASPRRVWGRMIEALGLKSLVPEAIYRKLDHPQPDTVLYRVGPSGMGDREPSSGR